MIRYLINLRVVILFISLLFLRIFLSSANVIDIISDPQKYLNKTVKVTGTVTDITSSGNNLKYHYLRGSRGGVILLYASEEFTFNKNNNYNIFGLVGYNVNYNEPFLITSTVNRNNDQKLQDSEYSDITSRSSDTTDLLLSGSSIVSFLKNSRISEFLLNLSHHMGLWS